jgi:plasmid stabilization system protein ParE
VALWAPETDHDLDRIWDHVETWVSQEAADHTVRELIRLGNELETMGALSSPWPGLFKKWVMDRHYLFVFRPIHDDIHVLGIFGRKEQWFQRMSARI